MSGTKNYLKSSCSTAFVENLRSILYNRELSWPAKCLAFALLDQPAGKKKVLGIIAKKFDRPASSISKWKKELLKVKAHFFENWENRQLP